MRTAAALCRHLTTDRRTDGELLAAFLAGPSEDAFAELVRRHGPLVWAACRRLLPDPTDAEDAFQATFLILVRRARGLTNAPTLGPWLHRTAALTARGLRRKNARRLAHRAALTDHVRDPARPPDTDLKADLDAALLALPAHYRDPIILCHLQGFSRREAAERLGCPEGTLSAWLSRGLEKLRHRLRGLNPTRVLTVATAGAPAALTASTARAAVASAVAAAGVPPTVSLLVEGVIHMFWVKKATAAAFALSAVFALGVGAGLSTRTESIGVGAQEKGVPATGVAPKAQPAIETAKEIASEMLRLLREQQELEEALEAVQEPVIEKKRRLDSIKTRLNELKQNLAKLQGETPFDPTQSAKAIAALEAEIRQLEVKLEAERAGLEAAERRYALSKKAGGSPKELLDDQLIAARFRENVAQITAQLDDAGERLTKLKNIRAAYQKAKLDDLKDAIPAPHIAKPQDIDNDPEVVAQRKKMDHARTDYEFRLNAADDKNAPGIQRLKAAYEEQKRKYEEVKKDKIEAQKIKTQLDALDDQLTRATLERDRHLKLANEATAEAQALIAYRQRIAERFAAQGEFSKRHNTPTTSYVELRISGNTNEPVFTVREMAAVDPQGGARRLCGPVTTRDPEMLAKLLARAKNDPTGPQHVVIIAQSETVRGRGPASTLKACDAAGYKTVKYDGYVFQGGMTAPLKPDQKGAVSGYKYYDVTEVKSADLLKEIEEGFNSF